MSLFLLTQSFSKTLKSSVYNSRKSSKRGASEIIGVMILLGVTVSGGLLVFTLLSTNDILDFATEEQILDPTVIAKLKLIGYDTRDFEKLYEITVSGVGNSGTSSNAPDSLCASGCVVNGDSEFIILKVRNDSASIVDIRSININEEEHVFDIDHTAINQKLETSSLPEQGEFIIIAATGTGGNIRQETSSGLPEGSEKRIIIRLNTAMPDIALNANIRVVINSSVETTQLLLVPAGSLA